MAENRDPRYTGKEPSFLSDDDPLAELARIAGYEAPRRTQPEPQIDVLPENFDLDLEAELLRDLADNSAPETGPSAERDDIDPEVLPAFLRSERQPLENDRPDQQGLTEDAVSPLPEASSAMQDSNPPADEGAVSREPEREPEPVMATVIERREPMGEPGGDIAEEWTDLPEWPSTRPAQASRGIDDVPDPYFSASPPVEPLEPQPSHATASALENDQPDAPEEHRSEPFDWSEDDARADAAIARSYGDDMAEMEYDEPLSQAQDDEPAPVDPVHQPTGSLTGPMAETGPDESHDAVFRDFEHYAIPERAPEPIADDAAPTVAARSNEWDIADELEQAFAELSDEDTAVQSAPWRPIALDPSSFRNIEPFRPVDETSREQEPPVPSAAYSDYPAEPDQMAADGWDDAGAEFAEPDDHRQNDAFPEPTYGTAVSDDDGLDFDFDGFEMEMEQAAEALLADEREAEDMRRSEEPAQPVPAPNVATVAAAAVVTAPAAAYEAPVEAAAVSDEDLVFDVRDVADMGDVVEPVRDIDVPDLPLDEERSDADPFDMSDLENEFSEILAQGDAVSVSPAQTDERSAVPEAASAAVEPEQIDFAEYDFSSAPVSPPVRGDGSSDAEFAAGRDAAMPPRESDLDFSDFDHPLPAAAGSRGGFAKWKIGAAAAAVLLCGVALIAVFTGEDGTSGAGEPRIIAANEEPIKIAPEDRGGRSVPNQDQAVYNQVDGSGGDDDVNLVSRSEEPVDVVQRTVDPQVLPLEGRPAFEPEQATDVAEAAPQSGDGEAIDLAALAGGTASQAVEEQGEDNRLGVTPRRVQTSVVRADGTLVPRESTAEPASDTPPLGGVSEITSDAANEATRLIESGQQTDETPASVNGIPLPQERPESANAPIDPNARLTASADSQSGQAISAPVRTVRTTTLTGDGQPTPGDRPSEQPVDIVGTGNTEQASVETPAPSDAQTPFDNPGGYVVQIASQPTEEGARSTYSSLADRFGSIIGGRAMQIQSADIPDRGTFYRVRVAGGTRAEATALCERYQAAGGSCFVAR
ncbi:SPOR domain-containing protein [Pararhizobium haloflavum]|uniref:SPOR domain-containing protein n=1 Tax=Pararhizobium haloflavum TaxID=2037914 RepID=UPI000C176265|nr:SPOR domain-containing protein [Pararhizobium haloflavum]